MFYEKKDLIQRLLHSRARHRVRFEIIGKFAGNSSSANRFRFPSGRFPYYCAAIVIPLTALNQYLLAWRKAHGRDIEAEEKHEFDEADIISLLPRQSHEHSSTYRR